MKVFVIALNGLRRLFRDPITLFFVLALPIFITLLIGVAVFDATDEAQTVDIGILQLDDGPLAQELVEGIEAQDVLALKEFQDLDALRAEVRLEQVAAGIVIPAGYDADLRAGRGAEVEYLQSPVAPAPFTRTRLTQAVVEQGGLVRAGLFATSEGLGDVDSNIALAAQVSEDNPGTVAISETQLGEVHPPEEENAAFDGFRYPSASNLILFIFITSLAGSSVLIESRRLGVSTRMLGTPTSHRTILAGETLGRFVVGLFQGAFIFVVATLVFGVDFGDPLGAGTLIVVFALVGTAVAMLFGTIFRTPEQAGAIGPPVGIAMGMLGGCMWPLEIVPEGMRTFGHITPHAWAMDAFIGLMGRGETVVDIAPQLAVLLGFVVVLLPLATWRLKRAIVR